MAVTEKIKEAVKPYHNYDAWTGIIRALVPAGVAWVTAKGVLPVCTATDGTCPGDYILAAAIAIAAAIWSVLNNKTGKVIGQ
jgi:hypothetical protein